MKKSMLYIGLALVLILLVFLLHYLYTLLFMPPAKRVVNRFLNEVTNLSKTDYLNYISPELKSDEFIKLLRHDGIIKNYRVKKTEFIEQNKVKVWVSFYIKGGQISAPIRVDKVRDRWLIKSLPIVTHIPGAIPISKVKLNRKTMELQFNVMGNPLTCTSPISSPTPKMSEPVSITLLNSYLVSFKPLSPLTLSKVLALSTTEIEDPYYGKFDIAQDFGVYTKKNDNFIYTGKLSLPIGTKNVILYCTEDRLGRIALYDEGNLSRKNIRVVLNDTSYSNLLHEELKITCKGGFVIKTLVKPQLEYSFNQGDEVVFEPSSEGIILYRNGKRLALSPQRWYISSPEELPLTIGNILRSYSKNSNGTPYIGSLEIALYKSKLVVINEVSLEKYLYSVVPSEMPVKFGLESLKVQAVAARSYAVRCFQSTGYSPYGAHVDDSTSSQVYNNIDQQAVGIQAVDDTYGLVPFYKDEVIDARFFSTSCGYTANYHEVWSDADGSFPPDEVPYLISKPQYNGDIPSLYNEENFKAFISQSNPTSYDRFSPLFRWEVTMTREELEASLNHNLPLVHKAQSSFILIKSPDGSYTQGNPPEDIEELQNIEVLRRGKGGNMMELELTTARGIIKVLKEFNIRSLIRPVNYLDHNKPIELKCYDESIRKDFSILPSAFAYINIERDPEGHIISVRFIGGGYGHGVGMSQYGTYGLTLLGKSFQEIIDHYYPGAEFKNIYRIYP